MQRMRTNRVWLLATVLALVVAACGGDSSGDDGDTATTAAAPATTVAPDTTQAPTETTEAPTETTEVTEFDDVTLLAVNNMAHLPVFFAVEFGLWTDRGINADVQTLGSGADIAAGLQSGQAEFGTVNGGTGVAPQRASGLLTKLVAPYNNDATNAKYVDWIGIVGRADSGITEDPNSLVGKVVGVSGGGTPRAYLRAWLNENGLTEEDIEIVTMGAPDMRTAVVNGDVDAAVPWSPFFTAALLELGDNGVAVSAGESLVLSSIGLGAVDGQMEAKRDIFKRMIEGLVESTYLIRQDPEGAAPVVLSFIEGVSEEAVIEAIKSNAYDPRVSVCTRYGVEITAQQLVDSGSIEGEFTADDLIDSSVLDEVLAEHPEWIADLPPLPESVEECDGYEG